ncbi:MAG: lysophospholipid acyltransferase family protein [Bacteroidaceae bacterium]|nr:lysophospholipid acyltransferase family protein [Bacteroidaceae bacterium]
MYYIIYGLVYLLSILPFWVLYGLADFLFIIIYYVARYRRKIVRKNLCNSFPEKSEKEIKSIERKFYRWFCDYLFETFKLLSISDKNLLKHIDFVGLEGLEDAFDRGQDCATILGHYCNWEWLSATGLGYKRHPEAITGLIYHRLRSKAMDRLFLKLRNAHKGFCVKKAYTLRTVVRLKKENKRNMFGYISDQTPKWDNIHLWLEFLNQDTPVFTGGERIMRMMDNAVFYVDMRRTKRGHYVANFIPITLHAKQTDEFFIVRQFFSMLEQSIRREPQFYLWTHNRWKRTREEYEMRMKQKNDSPNQSSD